MTKDELILLLQTYPHSPSLHFKLGLWYRSRGYNSEAITHIRSALTHARHASGSLPNDENFDEAQGWLEYGRLLYACGRTEEAEEAFHQVISLGQHHRKTLSEWGALLYDAGKTDAEICRQLQEMARNSDAAELQVGQTLAELGAYEEACGVLRRHTDDVRFNESVQLIYILCLIHTHRFKEAHALLTQRSMDPDKIVVKSAAHSVTAFQAAYLCSRVLQDGKGLPELSRFNRLETAKSAIVLGMIDIAMSLQPDPSLHESSELIYALYRQGYVDQAKTLLHKLGGIPTYERSQSSLDLCFIAAEMLYDQGEFGKAAQLFESIYATDPSHSLSRFAAASCFLEETRSSLDHRQERQVIGSDLYFQIDEYLTNITLALQIIQSTGWHTVWTPAQRRNHPAADRLRYVH
ncbi:tetratricopeptide repeat protein [Paenibacillus sp. XY044]|uniref:tetratricopeptide repeat protein n=1 Tax=Paenibacillus sp. XY044 TaxID=2026089 RepID=UPI000B99D052|nr:tetratricopeptide repeat protein [Paenibacillus sp. XY044]OZB94802.1 hypothetical protein CJP46_13795 [Paenibacillus sp. XY044]